MPAETQRGAAPGPEAIPARSPEARIIGESPRPEPLYSIGLHVDENAVDPVEALRALRAACPEAAVRLSPAAWIAVARGLFGEAPPSGAPLVDWQRDCRLLVVLRGPGDRTHAEELLEAGLPIVSRGSGELERSLGMGAVVLPESATLAAVCDAAAALCADAPRCDQLARRARAQLKRVRRGIPTPEPEFPPPPASVSPERIARARPAPSRRIVLRAVIDSITGYGQHALHTVRQLRRRGLEVAVEPIWVWDEHHPIPPDVRACIREETGPEDWEILLCPPHENPPTTRARVRFTMWESGQLPRGSVEELNGAEAVCVPCLWNQVCFDAAGVDAPLYKIPMGLDPEVFRLRPWPSGPLTFGAGGRMTLGGARKNVAQVAWAFHRAFPNGEDVRLQLKVHGDCPLEALPRDPRVTLLRENWNEVQMARWFAGLHVYVTMAASEGFGFMPLQAMACGRAVIGVIAHGHAEYMTPETVIEVPPRISRAQDEGSPRWEYAGYWYPPEEEAVIDEMRRLYRSAGRTRAWEIGQAAAVHASQFTWDRYGSTLLRALQEAGAVPHEIPSIPAVRG